MTYMTDLTDVKECSREGMSACEGELVLRESRTGLTISWMCEGHLDELERRLDDIERRYPEVNHPEYCGCWGCSEGSY